MKAASALVAENTKETSDDAFRRPKGTCNMGVLESYVAKYLGAGMIVRELGSGLCSVGLETIQDGYLNLLLRNHTVVIREPF